MGVPRCATCRWWAAPDDDYRVRDFAVRDPLTHEPVDPQPFPLRRCAAPRLVFHERPLGPGGAAVIDASQYFAALVTGPDFGCTLHEPPPTPATPGEF